MSRIIHKSKGKAHFIKDFGNGSCSERLVLPTPDRCEIKVTRFMPKAGMSLSDIVYDTDETVYLQSGKIQLLLEDHQTIVLLPGDIYVVPAQVSYGIQVLEDSEAICVFSRANQGPLPNDQ